MSRVVGQPTGRRHHAPASAAWLAPRMWAALRSVVACGWTPLLAMSGLSALAPAAHASPLTIAFTGVVTSDPYGVSAFGAPISGAYTFDSAAPDAVAGATVGVYASTGAAYGFSAVVDGTAYATPGTVTVNVANNIGSDQYGVVATLGDLTLELFLEDFTQTALSGDALPAGAPLLAAFAVRGFRLFGSDIEFLGSVDTLACTAGCAPVGVPEPGTLSLAALAGLLLLRGSRRRSARR